MALRDRIIEIAYRLKDQFSRRTGAITGSFERVGRASDAATDRLERNNNRLIEGFSRIGTFVTAALGGALIAGGARLRSLASDLDRVAKTSTRLGIGTEELSKLEFAAELAGVQSNQLALGLQRLVRRTAEAANGTGEARKALEELGLDAVELNRLSPDQVFLRVADAMQNVTNQSDRVRIGFKLFDAEGVALINTMNRGAAGIREAGDELERLGGVITPEATQQAELFNDSITRLNSNLDGLTQTLGVPFLTGLNELFDITGLGAQRQDLAGVTEQITELLERRSELLDGPGIFDAIFGDRSARVQELEEVEDSIRDLLEQRIRLTNQERENKESSDDLSDSIDDQKTEKKLLEDQEKNLSIAINTTTSELLRNAEALRTAEQAAENTKREFADLVDEITGVEEEDVTSLDVFEAISRAQEALRDGDPGRSLEILREGGEALRELKEQGEVADISLQDMARSLERVAAEAAEAETRDEVFNFESAQQQLQDLLRRQQALSDDPIDIVVQVDRSELDALNDFVPEPIEVPIVIPEDEQTAEDINLQFQLETQQADIALDEFNRKVETLRQAGVIIPFETEQEEITVDANLSDDAPQDLAQEIQNIQNQTVEVRADFDTAEIDNFVPPEITVPVRFEVVGGVPTFSDTVGRESDKRGFRP